MIDRKKMANEAERLWRLVDYSITDCQQFVENCAKVAGWAFNSRGSNDMYRNYLKAKGLTQTFTLQIGDVVFKWRKESDKLPSQYHGDGIGDMYHVGVVTVVEDNKYVVCHSASEKADGERDVYTSLSKLASAWKYAGTLKNTAELEEEKEEENSSTHILKPMTLTTGVAIEKQIWDYFKIKELNDFAVAGIMGNLFAESSLSAINLNNAKEAKLGYTDQSYTEAVDNQEYKKFHSDGAAYGLAQWAHKSRKKAMLEYAQSIQASIGNLEMQLDYLWNELNSTYKSTLNNLKNATSIEEASTSFLLGFEKPADQSAAVQNKRIAYSQKYYNKYADVITPTVPVVATKKYPATPFNVKVINDKLNHRTGAGKQYKTLGFIPMGSYTITKVDKDWGFINSDLGWILINNYNWVEIMKPYEVKVTTSALNVRKEPNASSALLGTIRDYGMYEITKTYENWGLTNLGWICLDYTTAKI